MFWIEKLKKICSDSQQTCFSWWTGRWWNSSKNPRAVGGSGTGGAGSPMLVVREDDAWPLLYPPLPFFRAYIVQLLALGKQYNDILICVFQYWNIHIRLLDTKHTVSASPNYLK